MNKLVALPITYNGTEYYSLVSFIKRDNCMQLRVTIMNGDLERLLYGNNVFEYSDGRLIADLDSCKREVATLKRTIANALESYLVEMDRGEVKFA
jgi:hypothetical protein